MKNIVRRGIAEKIIEVGIWVGGSISRPIWVLPINGIVSAETVEIDAAAVADGITGEEAALLGVVVAMAQQVEAGVIAVVAELTPEAHRAVLIREY